MKRLQNKVAGSRFTLPVVAAYAFCIWLIASPMHWPQLACFAATVYLLVELSNSNALLRMRSRMVSCTYIMFSTMVCQLFDSLSGCFTALCFTASLLILFHAYQDKQAVGKAFYAFACLGIASIFFVKMLWLIPVIWLLMATQLQALGWRTFMASVIGLIAPYWFFSLWFIYQQDFSPLVLHMSGLFTVSTTSDYVTVSIGQWTALIFALLLAVAGIIHFWLHSFEDNIRIRMLFGFFTVIALLMTGWIILQPQHYDPLIRLFLIATSPLAAHLFTHTSSRITNISFIVSIIASIAITVFNLWTF